MNTVTIRLPNSITRKASDRKEDLSKVILKLLTKHFSEPKEKMPPEKSFRPEFVAEMERRSREYHSGKGRTYRCRNAKEIHDFFQKAIHE